MTDEQNPAESAINQRLLRGGHDPRVIGKATQFQPGNNANPGGRPKRKWLTDVWDEMLEEKLSNPDDREAYKESTWRKMLAGNVVSAMTTDRVVERTEGKLPTNVGVTGNINVTLSERMSKAEQRLLSQDAPIENK